MSFEQKVFGRGNHPNVRLGSELVRQEEPKVLIVNLLTWLSMRKAELARPAVLRASTKASSGASRCSWGFFRSCRGGEYCRW